MEEDIATAVYVMPRTGGRFGVSGSLAGRQKMPDARAHTQTAVHKRKIISARTPASDSPCAQELRDGTLGQVEKGWLNGPLPYDAEGRLITGEGPKIVNRAFGFGAPQGDKWRAVDDLKRGQTMRAVATRAPINLPAWDIFAATIS